MGSQPSEVENFKKKVMNKSLINITTRNQTNCSSMQEANAYIRIRDITAENCHIEVGPIDQKVDARQNAYCVQPITDEAKFVSDLKAELAIQAQSELARMGEGYTSNDIETEIQNEVENNINIQNLMECISEQRVSATQIIENISARNCDKLVDIDPDLRTIRIGNLRQFISADTAMRCGDHYTPSDTKPSSDPGGSGTGTTPTTPTTPKPWSPGVNYDAGILAVLLIVLVSCCCSSSLFSIALTMP